MDDYPTTYGISLAAAMSERMIRYDVDLPLLAFAPILACFEPEDVEYPYWKPSDLKECAE